MMKNLFKVRVLALQKKPSVTTPRFTRDFWYLNPKLFSVMVSESRWTLFTMSYVCFPSITSFRLVLIVFVHHSTVSRSSLISTLQKMLLFWTYEGFVIELAYTEKEMIGIVLFFKISFYSEKYNEKISDKLSNQFYCWSFSNRVPIILVDSFS